MAVNCVIAQAEDAQSDQGKDAKFLEQVKELFEQRYGKKEDVITSYKNKLPGKYQTALAKELAGEEQAIENQFKANEKQNKEDEDKKKKYLDDSVVTAAWFGEAKALTDNSVKGYMQAEWAAIKKQKDDINTAECKAYTEKCNNYKNIVIEKVIPTLEKEIIHINYEMEKTFYRGLEICAIDKECLLDHNVHWPLTEEFLDRLINAAVDPVIKVVKDNGVPLTDDKVRMIADEKIFEVGSEGKKVKLSLASAKASKKRVMDKLHDLLNPKKDDDIQNDQNDQGALSQ